MNKHLPGTPHKVNYPGGKDGSYRVGCTGCVYTAWEATREKALARMQQHCRDKNAEPKDRS